MPTARSSTSVVRAGISWSASISGRPRTDPPRAVGARDLGRAGRARSGAAPRLGRADFRRERALLAAASAIRIRSHEPRLRPEASPARPPGPSAPGYVVAPNGRLIVGVFNEEVERSALEDAVRSWGFAVAGRTEHAHPDTAKLVRRRVLDRRPGSVGSRRYPAKLAVWPQSDPRIHLRLQRPATAPKPLDGVSTFPRVAPIVTVSARRVRDPRGRCRSLRQRTGDVCVRHRPDRGGGCAPWNGCARPSCTRVALGHEPDRIRPHRRRSSPCGASNRCECELRPGLPSHASRGRRAGTPDRAASPRPRQLGRIRQCPGPYGKYEPRLCRAFPASGCRRAQTLWSGPCSQTPRSRRCGLLCL